MLFDWFKKKYAQYRQGFCMFSGLPCRVAAIKPNDKRQDCVCLHCQAWLANSLPGFEVLRIKRELESRKKHMDAAYEVMRVSHASSKSLATHLLRWRKALEEIASSDGSEGVAARRALFLTEDQKTIDERGFIA